MLKKVKKVKTSVEFIQKANLTELENLVVMLQNSPAGNNNTTKIKRNKITCRRYPCRIGSHQGVHARSNGGNRSLERLDLSRKMKQYCLQAAPTLNLIENSSLIQFFRIAPAQKPSVEVPACLLFSTPILKASAT